MLKAVTFMVIFCNATTCNAQDFIIPKPKHKKNEFAKNFIKLLNDAPNNFNEFKENSLKKNDSTYPNKKIFGMTIQREPITFKGVICSPFISIPYTYAIITPKYDSGAYIDGLKLDIAKKRSRYPIRPITPFSINDSPILRFAKFI